MKKSIFVCDKCGGEYPKWQGSCYSCGAWDSIKELKTEEGFFDVSDRQKQQRPILVSKIKTNQQERIKTPFSELDRVLGGGFVPGESVLLGGEPGIGKSTLTMQVLELCKNSLYASAEESAEQIKLRFNRLGLKNNNLKILDSNILSNILRGLSKDINFLVVDSIQALQDKKIAGLAGNPLQVKNAAFKIIQVAKNKRIPHIIVSHITKSGLIAGPKTIEHLVDAVFYLEGEQWQDLRILRSVKNRFGAVNEIGLFKISGQGFREIVDSTEVLVGSNQPKIGSSFTVIMEGSRPLIIEVQALAVFSYLEYPKRAAVGLDILKFQTLIATLQNCLKTKTAKKDIFLKVASGLKIFEPASDLAVVLALFSALNKTKSSEATVAIGEVDLTGEVRPVSFLENRIKEVQKRGFKRIIAPNYTKSQGVIKVKNIAEAVRKCF